jgi:hypothetical protein
MIFTVRAAEVCVVVYYPDQKADGDCVNVPDGADGRDVLDKTNLDILWTPDSLWGQMVCKINGVGTNVEGNVCQYNGEFWNFVLKDGDEWGHSPVGLNGGNECWNRDFSFSDWNTIVHYCAHDDDLIGFAFGDAGAVPEMLKINDVVIKVDGKKSSADEKGGTIKDVAPESKIEIEVKVENLYPDETNIEIQDLDAEAVIENIDDGDDLDENSGEIDLDTEEKDSLKLEFSVPLEVEEDNYDMTLTISGDDEKGIHYEKELKYTVKVEKEKHDLKFTNAAIYPEKVGCRGTVTLNVALANIGTKEEDVDLIINNDALGINIHKGFNLDNDPFDEDSKFQKEYRLVIDDANEGIYPIKITAEYEDKKEEETVNLEIEGCTQASEKTEDIDVQVTQENPSVIVGKNTIQLPAKKPTQYGGLVFALGLISVALIIILITALMVFRR